MRSRRLQGCGLWVALGMACAWGRAIALAEVPSLTGIVPFGFHPGESVSVKVAGKLGGQQRRMWTDDPALVISAPDASGNAWVRVAPECGLGVHTVRMVNAEGVSAPVRVMVGSLPRVEEKEPNDRLEDAQPIAPLPAWIQGHLDRSGDVDGYALRLRRGVPILVRADAYELGAAVDLHLNLVDAKGQRVAMATDARNLDPRLEFTPPEDGVYVLQVQGFAHPPTESVFFAGSVKCPYLITVTDQPVATRVFPAVVPAQGSVEVALRGPGRNAEGERISLDRSMVQGAGEVGWVVPKGAVTPLNVVCSRFPVRRGRLRGEGEPSLLEVPGVLGGELGVGVTSAEWGVAMKKGEKLQARMWSRSLGLGLEGEITVRSPGGETVASSASGADVFAEPAVTWTAAVDGEYRVAVRDLFGRTGEAREYVLEVGAPEPSFGGELVGAKPVVVGAGKSVSLKVKVTLTGGWKEPLVVRVGGLPEGVFAPEVAVPEKGGEVEVSLQAAENAAAGTALAHVSVWTRSAPLRMVGAQFALRGELQRGHSDSDVSRELWVSVGPQGTSKAAEEVKR